ncbi:MAG: hypothetical protein M3Y87_37210 [Myxococcota bacterium]|nr:hypothetical protein [Myxococcota bacterium]
MAGCARSTTGDSCGAPLCTAWSTCSGFSGQCDITGTQTRTCTPRVCSGGGCVNGTAYGDSQACSRPVTGLPCDDGIYCTLGDSCTSSGFCQGTPRSPCIEP